VLEMHDLEGLRAGHMSWMEPIRVPRRRRRKLQPSPDWMFDLRSDFDELPDELLVVIFQKLDVPSLLLAGKVCRRWHDVSEANLVWSNMDDKYIDNLCSICGNALDSSKFHEAKVWLRRLLNVDPKHSCAIQNTAYLLEITGHREESLAWYDKMLELNPSDPNAYRNKCEILFVFKRFEDLLQLTEKWLQIKLNCYEGLYWKAVALMSLKRQDQLIQWIDTALANDPFHIQFLSNKGLVLFDQKKYSEALQQFEKVLSMDSNDLNAIINKAATLRKLKKYQKALIWCDKALQLCDQSKHFFCFYEKYALLVEMKRFDDAARLLDMIKKNFGEPVKQWESSQRDELKELKKKELKMKRDIKERKRTRNREKATERKKSMIKDQQKKFIISELDITLKSVTSTHECVGNALHEDLQKPNGIGILAVIFVSLTMITILFCLQSISEE